MNDSRPESLRRCLRELLRLLNAADVEATVIGGIAASLLGHPRVTNDVDALVLLPESDWKAFLDRAKKDGFPPRVRRPLEMARETRMLLLRHKATRIPVDLMIGAIDYETDVVKRSKTIQSGNLFVPVPRPEDLIVMKAVARRPRDMADIEGIVQAHAKLDLRRIRRLVREFAAALDAPDIVTELESVLARCRPRKGSQSTD